MCWFRTWKERIVSLCLENRIGLYSPHTSWDSIRGGVTDWLAKAIVHSNSRVITKSPNSEIGDDVGDGRFCDSGKAITIADAIESVKAHTGVPTIQLSLGVDSSLQTKVKTFAVCAGSGASVLKGVKADLYITGEMSHHDILDAAHQNVSVILCNHSNSERGYLKEFKNILTNLLDDDTIEIIISQCDADPLVTY